MQSFSARIYSLVSLVFFIVALALRLIMLLFKLSSVATVFFYLIVALGVVFIFLSSRKYEKLNTAFEFNASYNLNAFSYIASFGFFVSFIHQCVKMYYSIENGNFRELTSFVPICCICLFSLLSCFYYFSIGMSYGDRGYDFRALKVIHLVPMLWSIASVLAVMNEAISPLKEVDSVLKYSILITSTVFFYLFASEIENENGAKKSTVFFAKTFSYLSFMFFVDKLMLIVTKKSELFDSDSVLAISLLMISLFAIFFARNITNSTKGV